MPRLHKYRNRNACYVLTAIGGSVITYQLTPEGEKKLASTGIGCGLHLHSTAKKGLDWRQQEASWRLYCTPRAFLGTGVLTLCA